MAGDRVVVLTKDPLLGEDCARILTAWGHTCTTRAAGEDFDMQAFLDWLARDGQEVVLCEFLMSPLTALGLLNDLQVASLSTRVAVATLAYDNAGQKEFFKKSGAAYVVLGKSTPDLRVALEDAWSQLASHRQDEGQHRIDVIEYLRRITLERREDKLRRFAVELFNRLKYSEVRLAHGSREMGKDLVFYEKNGMGELEFVGVQVKAGDIHANVAKARNVTALWLQVFEAINSKIVFGGVRRSLDKYVILISGEFNEDARAKIAEFQDTFRHVRIYPWDRAKLADVVVQHTTLFRRFPD